VTFFCIFALCVRKSHDNMQLCLHRTPHATRAVLCCALTRRCYRRLHSSPSSTENAHALSPPGKCSCQASPAFVLTCLCPFFYLLMPFAFTCLCPLLITCLCPLLLLAYALCYQTLTPFIILSSFLTLPGSRWMLCVSRPSDDPTPMSAASPVGRVRALVMSMFALCYVAP
jgi:hypothetical protein